MDKEGVIGVKTVIALIIFMTPMFYAIHKYRNSNPVPALKTPAIRVPAGKMTEQPGMEKPHKYEVMVKHDSGRFITNTKVIIYAWTVKGAKEKALYIYGTGSDIISSKEVKE